MPPARLVAAALVAAPLSVLAAGQSAPPAPGIARVVVNVADAAPVINLTPDDFEIWSDDTPVAVRHLSSQPDQLNVLLLVDASYSALGWTDQAADSLTDLFPAIDAGLIANLLPIDRLGFGVFGRQIKLGPAFSADPMVLATLEHDVLKMDEHDRYGPSPIWDAVDAGVDSLAPRTGTRAVILMTDGRATGNRKSLSAVIEHAMRADVSISIVGRGVFYLAPDSTANAPSVNLKLMSDATGGVFPDKSFVALNVLLGRLLNQLHHTYTIEFAPPVADGAPHHLRVHVKKIGAVVHVRNMYWVERTP